MHHFFLRSLSIGCLSKSWLENVRTIGLRLGGACVVFAAFVSFVPRTGIAAIIAQDNAGNYPAGDPFTSGEDQGFGFGSWSVITAGTGGQNGIGTGPVFEISANSVTGDEYAVTRPFNSALNTGDTLSLLVVSASNPADDFNEVRLIQGGVERGTLYYLTGAATWGWADGGAGVDTGIATTATNVPFSFTNNGGTSYSVTFGAFSTTGNITGGGTPSASMDSVDFLVSTGATMEFNNLQIQSVPEPSTFAMLFAGGLTVTGAALRRRRRQG